MPKKSNFSNFSNAKKKTKEELNMTLRGQCIVMMTHGNIAVGGKHIFGQQTLSSRLVLRLNFIKLYIEPNYIFGQN